MLAGIEPHWKPCVWQGVLLMLLGILALLVPGYSTLAAEILLGWLMLVRAPRRQHPARAGSRAALRTVGCATGARHLRLA